MIYRIYRIYRMRCYIGAPYNDIDSPGLGCWRRAPLLGGLVLVKSGAHRYGERFLKYLVALGAGFMLAAIFIEILPETVGI